MATLTSTQDTAHVHDNLMIAYGGLYENLNWGASQNGTAGRGGDIDFYRIILAFPEVLEIPSGSTVSAASVFTYCYELLYHNDFALRKVLVPWVEGTANGTSQVGASCWNYAAYDTTAWNTAGCSGDGTDRAATPSASQHCALYWNESSGTGMVADVQDSVDTATHRGWLMSGIENTTYTYSRFHLSENATSSLRPKLTVEYTVGRQSSPFPMVRNI
jgi:hypothetical protein